MESPAHVLSHLHLVLKYHVWNYMCAGQTMHTVLSRSVDMHIQKVFKAASTLLERHEKI